MDRDRLVGALLGLAVGDALGAPMEFAPRDTLPAVTGMRGGGRFGLEAGQWTDDTSMALCLARSLIETGTFDLRDQAERFLRWRDEGYLTSTGRCFGIGHQTLWSLSDFARTRRVLRSPPPAGPPATALSCAWRRWLSPSPATWIWRTRCAGRAR
ncbi:ADP-ribosylglycohydrolase family protein [Actinomyces urogenitalis DSM 15434]|uniref:ADP-ribosylglycohydrolase family protein n=1 Tax=Actinomyces urogenitalis DSM 15434 TaxID=525246 RepID=C0W7I5_9ACTO|nr:ADP-ribosylglycohydrolase family protein [Actinomyces urogenitalis DSM 15434]